MAALRKLFPGCMPKTADLLLAQVSVPLSIWESAWVSDLDLLEETPFVLALDDYHLVGNPSIDLLLTNVLRYEPLSLHLILSARRSPTLSFSQLKVQGKVLEIKTADLRFTEPETSALLQMAVHVPLSAAALNQLQEKTEGWAAGLTLAAISLREEIQPEELVARLDGASSQVSDYLLDQAFNNQPQDTQDFLLKSAVFNQFCASMLAEVFDAGQTESEIQALLERIEASQLFLIPLDGHRTYYRYHHLFRQMLRSRQRLIYQPDQISLYQRRAAAWLTRQGRVDEAFSYRVATQDWVGAAQVVESKLCALLNSEDFPGIKRSIEYFPDDFIATRPGLQLMRAWIAHFGLRHRLMHSLTEEIQVMLDAASQWKGALESDEPPPGFEVIPARIIQAHVWELDSVFHYLTNQGSQALVLARQAVDSLPESWMFSRGNAMIYLGLSMVMEGQYSQTVEMVMQAFERLQEPGKTYGSRLLFTLAVAHLLHGELELCRQAAEQILRGALANNLLLMQGWGYYLLGRVYQEWNQLELAAGYFKLVVDQRFTSNLFTSLESIASYVLVLHNLGRYELAEQSLEFLQQLYSEQTPATPAPAMALMAWLKLQHGQRDEARRWAESYTAPINEQAIGWYHIPHIYKARILMSFDEKADQEHPADQVHPEVSGVVDNLLTDIQELAERTHNHFTLVRVLAMRAVWFARRGKGIAAQEILERALRLARPGWFIQAFVEQGLEILEILQAISARLKQETDLNEYVAVIIAAFSPPGGLQPVPPRLSEIRSLLTERELEVLELLAERLSINEISARLCISPNTVQQHTHHIYRKLNVANKRQAVASAIELGILRMPFIRLPGS